MTQKKIMKVPTRLLLLFLMLCSLIACELTPFQSDVKKYLPTQELVIYALKKYLSNEVKRIEKMKNFLTRHKDIRSAAKANEKAFLSNPLTTYLLVKSLTVDIAHIKSVISSVFNKESFLSYLDVIKFPSEEDLLQAGNSLSWFQATADIYEPRQIFKKINLTAEDCHDLGQRAFNIANHKGVIYWMTKALEKLGLDRYNSTMGLLCLEHIAYAQTIEGMVTQAINTTTQLLQLMPHNMRAQANLKELQESYLSGKSEKFTGDKDIIDYNGFQENIRDYVKLCRGEQVKKIKEAQKLVCRFSTNGNPYLLMQPVREEELNLSPRMVRYHGIISEYELEIIKWLASPKLVPADVNKDPGQQKVEIRISKSAWLQDSEHEIISRISRRVEAITGLSRETAEDMQVAHYGVGGYYRLHPDFTTKQKLEELKLQDGNRIATLLIYVSDVQEGGFTVFPNIGAVLKPEKGSAVFWYNLHKNGTGDYDTVHAACPVLAGTKWIANKWFHERGQEFRRPCALERFS